MEQYKQLNAELIEQVQKMKLEIASYNKEIIRLRHQLMDEHAKHVEKEASFKRACINLFRCIDLDMKNLNIDDNESDEFKPNLCEIDVRTERHRSSARSSTQRSIEVTTNEQQRPSTKEISAELRRSNELIEGRNSINPSPSRHANDNDLSDDSDISEIELSDVSGTLSPQINSVHTLKSLHFDEDDDESYKELPTTEHEEVVEDRQAEEANYNGLYNIIEGEETASDISESDFNDSDIENYVPGTPKLVLTSRRKDNTNLPKIITTQSSPLCDVTNRPLEQRRTPSPRVKLSRFDGSCRGKLQPKPSLDISIEQPRHAAAINLTGNNLLTAHVTKANTLSPMRLSRSGNCSQLGLESLCLENFAEIPTSTPNARQQIHKNQPQPDLETTLQCSDSSRPQRRCRPNSLKEPSIHTKLRNSNGKVVVSHKKKNIKH